MFNGIWLVASEPLTFQGRTVKAGERFHISRVHSGALLVTGRATIANPQPPPKQRAPEPPPPRRRGRPKKTGFEDRHGRSSSADTGGPDASQAAASAPASTEAVVIDTATTDSVEPIDLADASVTPSRLYQRRDLESEE